MKWKSLFGKLTKDEELEGNIGKDFEKDPNKIKLIRLTKLSKDLSKLETDLDSLEILIKHTRDDFKELETDISDFCGEWEIVLRIVNINLQYFKDYGIAEEFNNELLRIFAPMFDEVIISKLKNIHFISNRLNSANEMLKRDISKELIDLRKILKPVTINFGNFISRIKRDSK